MAQAHETSPAHWEAVSFLNSDDRILYRVQLAGGTLVVCTDIASFTDARIIAATPKLLEACETQLGNWRMLLSGAWNGSEEGIWAAIDSLEKVIAKAAGKIPAAPKADPSDSTYFIRYTVRDGEHEYLIHRLTSKATVTEAMRDLLSDCYPKDEEDIDQLVKECEETGKIEIEDGMRIIEDITVVPLTEEEATVLEKYL